MILGIKNVITWIEFNQAPYWKIHSKGNTLDVIAQIQKETISLEESKEELQKMLQILSPGTYAILSRKQNSTSDTKSGIYKETFSIHSHDTLHSPQNVAGTPIATTPEIDIEAKINERVEQILSKKAQEEEIKQLRERNKELEARSFSSHVGHAVGALSPYIPAIMAKLGIAATPGQIGKIENQNNTKMATENTASVELNSDEKRIEKALETLFANGCTVEDLELIANAIQDKPSLLNTVRNFLA